MSMPTPQQRLAASHARSLHQLANVRIPLYGLPADWQGTRMTGSTRFEHGVERGPSAAPIVETHQTVELVHEDGAGRLCVESSDHTKPCDNAAVAELLESDAATYTTLAVGVMGRAHTFAAAHDGDRWVARWQAPDHTVTITAQRWPFDIALVRITDLGPYHAGRLHRLEQRSGFRLH